MVCPRLWNYRDNQANHHHAAQRSISHPFPFPSHRNTHHANLFHHRRHKERRRDGRHDYASHALHSPTDRREGHTVDGAKVL